MTPFPPPGYEASLHAAALFEQSHRGKLEVSGPDAPTFLSNLSTNDVQQLPLGGGCETYFCDHRAKVLAHALAYHVLVEGKHAFWLDVAVCRKDALLQHLDRHLISEQVELIDHTATFAQFHLAGPAARSVLEKVIGSAIPELSEFLHMERTLGMHSTCHIRRYDPLGVPGYDLVCRIERADAVRQMLQAAGATLGGADAYEILRVENVTPLDGIDIDENRFVMEVARAPRAVCYTKGCFLGQEPIVMARDRAGHINRAFLPLKVLEGGVIPSGAKLFAGVAEVGLVTSSVLSPRFGAAIALGYVRRGFQSPGLQLHAETPEGRRLLEVLPGPSAATAA